MKKSSRNISRTRFCSLDKMIQDFFFEYGYLEGRDFKYLPERMKFWAYFFSLKLIWLEKSCFFRGPGVRSCIPAILRRASLYYDKQLPERESILKFGKKWQYWKNLLLILLCSYRWSSLFTDFFICKFILEIDKTPRITSKTCEAIFVL